MSNSKKSPSYLYHQKLKQSAAAKFGIGTLSIYVLTRVMPEQELVELITRYKEHVFKGGPRKAPLDEVAVHNDFVAGTSIDDLKEKYKASKNRILLAIASGFRPESHEQTE